MNQDADQQHSPRSDEAHLLKGCLLAFLVLVAMFALTWAALDGGYR